MLLVALATTIGCDDVPVLHETTTARVNIVIAPPDDQVPVNFGHYRWEIVEAPAAGRTLDVSAQTASLPIAPPARGVYAFDRWFVSDTSEQLSYHVILDVAGAPPKAYVLAQEMVSVGEATTIDATASSSAEGLALTFVWRMAIRPAGSIADLADQTDPIVMFVPDAVGHYGIELRVFDGELWSEPTLLTFTAP